jgi:hypothetical protein
MKIACRLKDNGVSQEKVAAATNLSKELLDEILVK